MKRQMKDKTEELDNLDKTPIEALWERDLDELCEELDAIDAYEAELAKEAQRLKDGKRGRSKLVQMPRKSKGRIGGGRGADDGEVEPDAEEEEDDDEEDESP